MLIFFYEQQIATSLMKLMYMSFPLGSCIQAFRNSNDEEFVSNSFKVGRINLFYLFSVVSWLRTLCLRSPHIQEAGPLISLQLEEDSVSQSMRGKSYIASHTYRKDTLSLFLTIVYHQVQAPSALRGDNSIRGCLLSMTLAYVFLTQHVLVRVSIDAMKHHG